MKLAIIISNKDPERNWNVFRLANFAISQGDEVKIFLIGAGVEYEKDSSEKFNLKTELEKFLAHPKAQILACGTCLKLRNQKESKTCPINALEDLYKIIKESDKILTF